MFTTLDRMFFTNYLRSYLIVLSSLLSLYIIVDLFTNLDEFSHGSFVDNMLHIGKYYSTRISQIFDRLSEALTLLGAMFTVAWMQRNNELLPQLSAGISTRRVIRPVLFGCVITLALGPLNQELIIPRIAEDLTTARDDPKQERWVFVKGAFDPNGIHLEGAGAVRKDKKVFWLDVTFPEGSASGMAHLTAKEAVYEPLRDDEPYSGGWMLFHTTPEVIDGPLPPCLERISYGKYFLRTREADFESITRGANWLQFTSTPNLREELAKPGARRQPAVAVMFHMRLTRPLIGILFVFMGLAVILRDQNRHVFINAGLCLVLCALFYAAVYGCKFLGENDFIPAALAAWMPVLIFGPFTVALFDAIHT